MTNCSEERHQTKKPQTGDPAHCSPPPERTSNQGETPYAVIWKDGEELLLY